MTDIAGSPHRLGRLIAALAAALIGAKLVFSLVTGLAYSGARSGAYFDRSASPLIYRLYIAMGLVGLGYALAIALGHVLPRHDPTEWEERKLRNQRGATLFGLVGCAVLLFFWVEERPAGGASPAHSVLGLGIVALVGFLAVTAPLSRGPLNVAAKVGGLLVIGLAWSLMYQA